MKKYLGLLAPVFLVFGLASIGYLTSAETPEPPLIEVVTRAQVGQQKELSKPGHGRGRVKLANEKELIAASWARHAKRLMALPKVTAPTWDCRTLGFVTPVDDQGSCGSCWDVSATGVLATAFCKAGLAKPDGSFNISAQYIMDNCGPSNGGCNGDDASTPIFWCKTTGIPTTADYGPYTASSGSCQLKSGTKLWKIDDYGYAGPTQGIAPTQAIKDAIVAYGPISSAVDAGGFNGYTSGVMSGDGNNIDHDVSIAGWKTVNNVTIWLVKNQWSDQFGEQGYCWIPEGKWSIGTSALWVLVNAPAPSPGPPIPPPTPPGPLATPLKLFEGTSVVGNPAGYLSLASAEKDANAAANKDNVAVTIKDAKGVLIETVQPGVIPPPAPTGLVVNVPAVSFTVPGHRSGLFGRRVTGSTTITLPPITLPVVPAK
jgi:hypothetical protein